MLPLGRTDEPSAAEFIKAAQASEAEKSRKIMAGMAVGLVIGYALRKKS